MPMAGRVRAAIYFVWEYEKISFLYHVDNNPHGFCKEKKNSQNIKNRKISCNFWSVNYEATQKLNYFCKNS